MGGNIVLIGAYQFAVTKNISDNFEIIKKAILQAAHRGVNLLVFPECALTGYPPHNIEKASLVDFGKLDSVYWQLQNLVNNNHICVIVGTITQENDRYYNSAIAFIPYKEKIIYSKRGLWGWDKENFSIGNDNGVFDMEGWRIGIRICFEVRFPEFFRELYKEHTNLNIILFYDVSDCDDMERYEMIKSHIRTRAVENITYTLSVDTIYPYQTAPTALYDRSGHQLCELKRNEENLLIYELNDKQLDFGERGRKEISDRLTSRETLHSKERQ